MTRYDIVENITKEYELPCFDRCKSFYGKAKVLESRSRVYLLSYDTIVCYFDHNNNKFSKTWNGYSVTTMRHVNSFLSFLGFSSLGGKKFWDNLNYGFEYGYSELLNII